MRYRFLMSLFGMSLDKQEFMRDFGVPIDMGLPVELTYMRSVGAFEVDTPEKFVLSAKGRYLLVSMMREFFVGVNNLRDQARAALTPAERRLLFGDGEYDKRACAKDHPLARGAGETELAQELPIP